MRRSLVLAFVIVMASCSSAESDPPATTTIVVATSTTGTTTTGDSTTSSTDPTTDTSDVEPTGDVVTLVVDPLRAVALATTAAAFTEATGVGVELVAVENVSAVRDRARSSDVDLFIGPHTWRTELLAEEAIAGIGGFTLDDFSPVAAQAFTVDGVVHGVPYAAETLVLYVNRDVYGAELPADLGSGCDGAVDCFVMPGLGEAGGYHITPFLMAGVDGDLLDVLDAGEVSGDGLAAFAALDASPRHDLTTIAAARSRIVSSAGLFVGGPWDLGPIEDAGIDFAVVPLPPYNGVQLQPPVAVQGFYLAATAPNPDDAVRFLTGWLAHPDAQRELWHRDRRAPVHVDLVDLGPPADVFADGVAGGFLLPAIDLEPVWEELGVAAGEIYAGTDPLAAVADAAQRIRERLR